MKRKPGSSCRFSQELKRTASWTLLSDAGYRKSEKKSNSTTRFNVKKELAVYEAITLTLAAMVGTIILTHAGVSLIAYLIS